jgi:hypothetical protein
MAGVFIWKRPLKAFPENAMALAVIQRDLR